MLSSVFSYTITSLHTESLRKQILICFAELIMAGNEMPYLICLQLGPFCCLSHWILDWHLVSGQMGEGRYCARHARRGWQLVRWEVIEDNSWGDTKQRHASHEAGGGLVSVRPAMHHGACVDSKDHPVSLYVNQNASRQPKQVTQFDCFI